MALALASALRYFARRAETVPTMYQVPERAPAARESGSSRVEVRPVTGLSDAEFREAVALLVKAFDGSTLFQLAFPEPVARHKLVDLLFSAALKDALRFGQVELAYNAHITGVFIWYPPGLYPLSALRTMRLLPEYLRMLWAAPLGIAKLARANLTLNRLRPRVPHCHGYFLGGGPGEQVGSLLGRRVLRIADEVGHPIYLETQEPRAVNLYTRHGFRMLENGIETVPGGPLTWTMWREPRQATTATRDIARSLCIPRACRPVPARRAPVRREELAREPR
jgi:hypothetical protein